MVAFLLSVAVAIASADDEGGCQISGYMRGVIDDIHLLVHEDMCTIVEVEEIRTILSNQQTEMSAISTTLSDQKTQISAISATLNNQKTDISTIKDQMNKMMSMLQKLEKSGKNLSIITLWLSICYFDIFLSKATLHLEN